MTDRELLELAAKAAGIEPVYCYESRRNCLRVGDKKSYAIWRPLTDDGEALRLAVNLGIQIDPRTHVGAIHVYGSAGRVDEPCALTSKPYAETRRAIVRAAAEIGRTKPDRMQPVEVSP